MNCGMECIKYILFLLNFFVAICGIFIIFLGVSTKLSTSSIDAVASSDVNTAAIAIIIFGSVIFIIAFLGCCGAIRENHCFIVTFAIIMLTILILLVAIAAFAFFAVKNAGDNPEFQEMFKKIFDSQPTNEKNQHTFSNIQSELQCCGLKGPLDYNVPEMKPMKFPESCCEKNTTNCNADNDKVFKNGCYGAISSLIRSGATSIGTYALVSAAIQAIVAVFSFCLANSIKNAERRGYRV